MKKATHKQALKGLKVLDFTWVVAGPISTKYLGDYGATVIKIESREHPDFLRTSGPFKDHKADPNGTGYFAFFNANKFSMLLKLNHPQGLLIAKKLISWADIVVENYVPGTLEKLGLDYEHMKAINQDIIMISASGQGQIGPYARVPIGGNWLSALTGFFWFSGWPDSGVSQPYGAYSDLISPRFMIVAILAALRYRQKTGKGQYIDFSQFESGIQFLSPAMLDWTANSRDGERIGNAAASSAPHGVFPCLEGRWCALSVSTEDEWTAFCKVIGGARWTKEVKYASLWNRKQNEDELNKLVAQWTIRHTPEQVMLLMQKAGVPAGVVESTKDLCEDPQLKFRNHFWTLDHPVIGPYAHLGQASILKETPAKPRMPAPCLGEHTEYVCRKLLNISDKEFVEYLNGGAFGVL